MSSATEATGATLKAIPDDLRQLAEMRGLNLTPFKAHGEILFFVRCDGELVYSGNSFDGRDLQEFTPNLGLYF